MSIRKNVDWKWKLSIHITLLIDMIFFCVLQFEIWNQNLIWLTFYLIRFLMKQNKKILSFFLLLFFSALRIILHLQFFQSSQLSFSFFVSYHYNHHQELSISIILKGYNLCTPIHPPYIDIGIHDYHRWEPSYFESKESKKCESSTLTNNNKNNGKKKVSIKLVFNSSRKMKRKLSYIFCSCCRAVDRFIYLDRYDGSSRKRKKKWIHIQANWLIDWTLLSLSLFFVHKHKPCAHLCKEFSLNTIN